MLSVLLEAGLTQSQMKLSERDQVSPNTNLPPTRGLLRNRTNQMGTHGIYEIALRGVIQIVQWLSHTEEGENPVVAPSVRLYISEVPAWP